MFKWLFKKNKRIRGFELVSNDQFLKDSSKFLGELEFVNILSCDIDDVNVNSSKKQRCFMTYDKQNGAEDKLYTGKHRAVWAKNSINLEIPKRATKKSSGYDFYSPFSFVVEPNESIAIPLGIKAYMQDDEELLLFPRSSIGFKYKVKIDNTIAKIDSDYYNNESNEGDICVFLTNTGDKPWAVEQGDKICQGTFYKYLVADDDAPVSKTRIGGIGSSGK